MKLNELNNYVLHDSCILKVTKQDNNLTFEIMYCLFMQNNYKEGDPENARIELTFHNVKDYSNEKNSYDSDEIIEININNDEVTIIAEDFKHNTYTIKFKASSYDFKIIEIIDSLD